MKVFISWSGGKETSLSCFRAMQNKYLKAEYLLNMVSEDGSRSRSHGLSAELLRLQAEAIEIPIIQSRATWDSYEEEFKKTLLDFKAKGIQAGVFGDIDMQEHRDWVEKVCDYAGVRAILPLWKEEREKLLEEFIQAGFRAVVVATNADFLGEEWLGMEIDRKFIKKLKALENVDLCGEKGEYHSFVYRGPLFKKPVRFSTGKKVLRERHWFLELIPD